jgi:membrane-bound ClpP family serine protease
MFGGPHVGTWREQTIPTPREHPVIILGLILLIIGFVAKVAIIWTIGIIVLIVGAILMLLGRVGHAIGPRRHYF